MEQAHKARAPVPAGDPAVEVAVTEMVLQPAPLGTVSARTVDKK